MVGRAPRVPTDRISPYNSTDRVTELAGTLMQEGLQNGT